jgi:putative transposase
MTDLSWSLGLLRLMAYNADSEYDKYFKCRTKSPLKTVHHSDRGLQYASAEYAEVLENNRVIPSMSRPANPYDNASCESFMKTLKREEIYANKYDDLEHLRANIREFIEQYYNRLRLHSALGYQSPEEFEQRSESLKLDSRSATMEFFGNKVENQDEHSQRNSTATLGKWATSPPSQTP